MNNILSIFCLDCSKSFIIDNKYKDNDFCIYCGSKHILIAQLHSIFSIFNWISKYQNNEIKESNYCIKCNKTIDSFDSLIHNCENRFIIDINNLDIESLIFWLFRNCFLLSERKEIDFSCNKKQKRLDINIRLFPKVEIEKIILDLIVK
jgi:DNA-directed RNA polymerase subunit RPC12/RpoP